MIRRTPRPKLPNGVGVKKRILVEGLALIRLLRSRDVSLHDAKKLLGIPRREFYRYLHALRLARAPMERERLENGRYVYRITDPSWP